MVWRSRWLGWSCAPFCYAFFGERLLHPLIPWNPEDQAGIAKLQVLITAGKHDPICPPGETDRFFNYLTRQQANVELYWNEGGHEIGQGELEAIRGFLLRT